MTEPVKKISENITFRLPQQMYDECEYLVKPQFGSIHKLLRKEIQKTIAGDFHAFKMGMYLNNLQLAQQDLYEFEHQDEMSLDPMLRYDAHSLLAIYPFHDERMVKYQDRVGSIDKFETWAKYHHFMFDDVIKMAPDRLIKLYQMTYQWYLKSSKIKMIAFKVDADVKQAFQKQLKAHNWELSVYFRHVLRYYIQQSVTKKSQQVGQSLDPNTPQTDQLSVSQAELSHFMKTVDRRLSKIEQNQLQNRHEKSSSHDD